MRLCDYCRATGLPDFRVGDYKFCGEDCATEKWAELESQLQAARAAEAAALRRVAELEKGECHSWGYSPFGYRICVRCKSEQKQLTDDGDWLPSSKEERQRISRQESNLLLVAQLAEKDIG